MTTTTVPELIIPSMGHFRFIRSLETALYGEGNWITVRPYKGLPANTIVCREVQDTLSSLARERKIPEAHNYRHTLPKPEKQPTVRGGPRKEKPSDGILRGSFNPFAAKV